MSVIMTDAVSSFGHFVLGTIMLLTTINMIRRGAHRVISEFFKQEGFSL